MNLLCKAIIIFILLVNFSGNSFADEIRLKDGVVVKCKIIKVTPEYIKYDPEGSRSFDMIPRNQVLEIVYDDGTKIKLK